MFRKIRNIRNLGNFHIRGPHIVRTVRYTDIPKISVLNQYRYIDTGYSTIPIYRNFRYTGIFQYIVLNLPTIWRNHNLYFATEWQFKELSTAMI